MKARHAKNLRRSELAQRQAIQSAVRAETRRCTDICDAYAEHAKRNGLIVHPQIADEIKRLILADPSAPAA